MKQYDMHITKTNTAKQVIHYTLAGAGNPTPRMYSPAPVRKDILC